MAGKMQKESAVVVRLRKPTYDKARDAASRDYRPVSKEVEYLIELGLSERNRRIAEHDDSEYRRAEVEDRR